jgi:hypothetical protein
MNGAPSTMRPTGCSMNAVLSSCDGSHPIASPYASVAGRPSNSRTVRFATSALVTRSVFPVDENVQVFRTVNGPVVWHTIRAAPL